MVRYNTVVSKPRLFQQLTGLSPKAFDELLPAFVQAEQLERTQREHKRTQPRRRRPGGGRKPLLASPADRLLFILVYFKAYPLQDVQAYLFGLSQAQAWEWIHRLTPVLNQALGAEQHLPTRQPAPLTRILRKCPGLEFIIDATERPIQRPKDPARQRHYYSGKKKRHTLKNIVVVEKRTRRIRMLSPTVEGKRSDKRLAEEQGYRFPKDSRVWCDLGFQGYQPQGAIIIQAIKKPRKQELRPGQKHHNRAIARGRIAVEHAIGGVKVFHITRDVYRNHRQQYDDLVIETACGLHNWRLNYRLSPAA